MREAELEAVGDPATGEGPRRRGVDWKKVALAAVLVAALAAFFLLGGSRWASFETLKAHRAVLHDFTARHYWEMLAGATLAYALATALSFPAGVMMSLAMGFLFGRWVGTAAVVLAATIGATAAFLSARYLFADAARRRMGPRLSRLARGFEEDAWNYLLFVRLVPVFPFWLMNLVPAFTPVRTRTFFAATAIGILPGSFVFVNLGESLSSIDSTRDLVSAELLLSLALLGVLALVPIAWKKLRTSRTPGATP
ncbi:MAG TPA: TVP38/TMEM64 family protein [Longimicrobium sp.]|nr:TVP38/TMEM64 family protein [Longimicrobium sp.]